jgi:hypothetical protein
VCRPRWEEQVFTSNLGRPPTDAAPRWFVRYFGETNTNSRSVNPAPFEFILASWWLLIVFWMLLVSLGESGKANVYPESFSYWRCGGTFIRTSVEHTFQTNCCCIWAWKCPDMLFGISDAPLIFRLMDIMSMRKRHSTKVLLGRISSNIRQFLVWLDGLTVCCFQTFF